MATRLSRTARWVGFCAVAIACTWSAGGTAFAGGGPENLLIIIDPSNPESKYVGNYYKNARNVPDRNVIYLDPGATNYTDFTTSDLDGFLGMLTNRRVDDHIDYVLIMPGAPFFVTAGGFISDACSPVTRFAIGSLYTMAFIKNDILGGLPLTQPNHFYLNSDLARAFDGSTPWLNGAPSTNVNARRYVIGAMLGYSGLRGNTIPEIIALIDRSAAVDGTRPAGTFYFMQTTDALRSAPRDFLYPAAVASIAALGGQAEHLMAVLPAGRHDILGIMTGWASPDIDGTNMTILPGAFCDHLTSFAGRFDIAAQTKMSRWIANGASGSLGAVEEPCNYPGKFPTARLHVHYFQGLSLGEAYFRSAEYVPFQMLLYGDPLTQPFAYLPSVTVPNAPTGPVSGTIPLTPSATTGRPGAAIAEHDLLIDGRRVATVADGGSFSLDTTSFSDGMHDVRVISYDNTLVRSQGRWLGQIVFNNLGRTVNLGVTAATPAP
ncbi:MAG: TIGR03790 family protein, partial [Phycisphaerae bacterium]